MSVFISAASLLLSLPVIAHAAWVYPPPLPSEHSLAKYTTGRVATPLSYAANDSVFGGFDPSDVDLYQIQRCTNVSSSNTHLDTHPSTSFN